ncbi:hypothetical protein BRYFOR_07711 [Marvinbryantia formatexigens DSM 14469]|uniref:Uncharacterized protein n=1 Tax=Marvinbryantia formatexigens DSM 14469 TaxID=478749 RepID=C6LGF1_9FIRM|nr:hypothetical protein [Marvinbryantia formatexigens]EET60151.1 hypothetical protein BRYFOR_07711 [Marvinbryantia formatexigens DSM 14469]SDF60521.1 hypothetical protein SAMN05660368_01024 [Marvinbryantia formatexigens]
MSYNTEHKNCIYYRKTLIVGIDVGSETHYARAFDWRNYEYSIKLFAFNNDESGFAVFKTWMEDKHGKATVILGMEPYRLLLAEPWSVPAGTGDEAGTCESASFKEV